MIWPSNGLPKAKGIMMTDDSMMTVWVRKGLSNVSMLVNSMLNGICWRFPEISTQEIILCELLLN